MIAGEVPFSYDTEAEYGIALVKTNNIRRKKGVALGYVIEDSDIPADEVGSMVPLIRWTGEIEIDADVLANGEKARRGPEPTTQPKWEALFDDLFGRQDTWLASEVRAAAEAAGLPWDNKVYDKVTERYGIRKYRVARKRGMGGTDKHYWTTKKISTGEAR
jgi:hypothetical protein